MAEGYTDDELALLATAFELERRGKGFLLRALVEDWDLQRLIREMY